MSPALSVRLQLESPALAMDRCVENLLPTCSARSRQSRPPFQRRSVRRRKRGGCHLIEKRLEQMVIRPVDYGDAHLFARQLLGRFEPAKSSADDHDARFL